MERNAPKDHPRSNLDNVDIFFGGIIRIVVIRMDMFMFAFNSYTGSLTYTCRIKPCPLYLFFLIPCHFLLIACAMNSQIYGLGNWYNACMSQSILHGNYNNVKLSCFETIIIIKQSENKNMLIVYDLAVITQTLFTPQNIQF